MPIADKDRKYMEEVTDYFQSTIDPVTMPEGSIRETAIHFNLTRTKVQKILVTMGVYSTEQTERIQALRNLGMSVDDIAAELNLSKATVSASLPYTNVFLGTAEPSDHAKAVREYRAYEREQAARTKKLKSQEDDWKRNIKRDKAMSFKTDWTRPPRITWENLEGMMPPEKYAEMMEHVRLRSKRAEADRAELDQLQLIGEKDRTEAQKERIAELVRDLGLYPGALNYRNKTELEALSGDRLPFEPHDVMRLHLELVDWLDKEEYETLKVYGGVKGDTISRDIVVPSNIPLYALHYVIQRAFGWQNSHLHEFMLTDGRLKELCEDSPVQWQKMVGIMFRSPRMDEDAQFWADDYERGSFKNWLRKKYTGPYMSQCKEEGLFSSFYGVQDIRPDDEVYMGHKAFFDDMTVDLFCGWVKNGDPTGDYDEIKKVRFRDLPLKRLYKIFDQNPFALLERLPLDAVLCPGFDGLPPVPAASPTSTENGEDNAGADAAGADAVDADPVEADAADDETQYFEENTCRTVTEELTFIDARIDEVFRSNVDSPFNQVLPLPFATELYYHYDFGDNWRVRITASYNCLDMVESGTVDQDVLDRANIKCRETYRPVLIARDGEMVMDDIGNLTGFADFLRAINQDWPGRKEMLEWAKGQGWKRNDATDFNLL